MKLLNLLFLAAILSFGTTAVNAQPLKTGMPVAYKASMDGWLVKLQEAQALSQKTGKPIMANFTGTDWCSWCIKLKKEVFLTPEFKAWAKENVILLELDFPKRFQLPAEIKQQNYQMSQALGVRGYPTIWFFTLSNNDQGQVTINQIGTTGYVQGGPSAYIAKANQILGK